MGEETRLPRRLWSRRELLVGSGVLAAGMTLYSGEIARHELDVVERTSGIRNLPDAFHGIRLAQLSDIHLDEYTEPYFLERVVQRVNALKPDIVLLTGDFITRGALTFVTHEHAARRCAEILGTLECQERYAVLGNHDVSVSRTLVTRCLHGSGISVLRNSSTMIRRGNDQIVLCGTADPGTDTPDLNRTLPRDGSLPCILMVHAPDYADAVVQHPRGQYVSLMLSGHSHGGQVRAPLLGPLVVPPLGRKYVQGLFVFGTMQLYVNRGIGTVGVPFRLNCPPEITIHTLRRSNENETECREINARGPRVSSAGA